MKKQEGITLISLVAYIAVAMIVIGVMAVVSSYFYKNIDWVKDREKHAQEFNKFNMFFIGDVKANKDATVSGAQIEFADGTIYRYDKDNGIIKLLDPPFEKSKLEPGYIKAYIPGTRENGGQYTHVCCC